MAVAMLELPLPFMLVPRGVLWWTSVRDVHAKVGAASARAATNNSVRSWTSKTFTRRFTFSQIVAWAATAAMLLITIVTFVIAGAKARGRSSTLSNHSLRVILETLREVIHFLKWPNFFLLQLLATNTYFKVGKRYGIKLEPLRRCY